MRSVWDDRGHPPILLVAPRYCVIVGRVMLVDGGAVRP
jgi:hypothetical protein